MSDDASPVNGLTVQDRFEILEQLNLHQMYIDNPFGIESVRKYQSLYWPEAKFTAIDLATSVYEGHDGLKQLFDYDHSVVPIGNYYHSMGPFEIRGAGDEATAEWRWLVSWRDGGVGPFASGTYSDRFEKRDGVWKCLDRVSRADANFPGDAFRGFMAKAKDTLRSSGTTDAGAT